MVAVFSCCIYSSAFYIYLHRAHLSFLSFSVFSHSSRRMQSNCALRFARFKEAFEVQKFAHMPWVTVLTSYLFYFILWFRILFFSPITKTIQFILMISQDACSMVGPVVFLLLQWFYTQYFRTHTNALFWSILVPSTVPSYEKSQDGNHLEGVEYLAFRQQVLGDRSYDNKELPLPSTVNQHWK